MRATGSTAFIFLVMTCQILVGGNCVTCRDFNTNGSGYASSPGLDCSSPPLRDCFIVANVHASLTPGVLVEERNGAMQVAYVFPESPAARAGVAAGDRIDSINGSRPGASCPSSGWAKGASTTTHLVLLRGAVTKRLDLDLVSLPDLVASAAGGSSRTRALLSVLSRVTQSGGEIAGVK